MPPRPKNDKALRKALNETFRTPASVFQPFIAQYPTIIRGDVLDPSAGDGRYIQHIMDLGNSGRHAVYDIRPSERATWKLNGLQRTLGVENCCIGDWLAAKRTRRFDCIISNPPFSLAQDFVAKGLTWLKPNGTLILLHRLNWLGTRKRSLWLQTTPLRYVVVIAARPIWEIDGRDNNRSDTYEYAFFVWQSGFVGAPNVQWLFPPDKAISLQSRKEPVKPRQSKRWGQLSFPPLESFGLNDEVVK